MQNSRTVIEYGVLLLLLFLTNVLAVYITWMIAKGTTDSPNSPIPTLIVTESFFEHFDKKADALHENREYYNAAVLRAKISTCQSLFNEYFERSDSNQISNVPELINMELRMSKMFENKALLPIDFLHDVISVELSPPLFAQKTISPDSQIPVSGLNSFEIETLTEKQ